MVKAADVLRETLRQRRSPLALWLSDNFDELAPIVEQTTFAPWSALAEAYEKHTGKKKPTRQGMQKAWIKLAETRARPMTTEKRLNAPDLKPPIPQKEQPTNVSQPKRDSFNFDKSPREDDKSRLWGDPKKE